MERRRGRWVLLVLCCATVLAMYVLVFNSTSSSDASLDIRLSSMDSHAATQGVAAATAALAAERRTAGLRRRLVWVMVEKDGGGEEGIGSSPPRCTAKCGACTPCTPVHVPVPPGTPVLAEYYPEAWRCKCGSKLYMP